MNPDFLHELQQAGLDVRTDVATRILYSTDASLYQVPPFGAAFPRTLDQLSAAVELAARYRVPVLARGAGSSLAGQAIGEALILDCSRHLDAIGDVQPAEGGGWQISAQPGAILRDINRVAAAHGLMIGPDPASGDRATLGGSLANNASGSHSIVYGMFADHVIALNVIFGDGQMAALTETNVETWQTSNLQPSTFNAFLETALSIRESLADEIRARWPRTYRRAAGYNLNYLLPWSPSAPPHFNLQSSTSNDYPPISPNHLNLAHLIVGSEGTLGVIREATIRLVLRPRRTVLAVLAYDSVAQACEATPRLLEHRPSAIELIPRVLLELAASVPAYARLLDFIPAASSGLPAALLAVEFAGDTIDPLLARARALRSDALIAETLPAQARVWAVRKAGLGILQSQPGDLRTHTFVEDLTVPVENLAAYVRAMDVIAAAHDTEFYYYAHASAGCLHVRPLVNLKTERGLRDLRQIAQEAVRATIALGGTTTGEHGDGLARSEWLEQLYGPRIVAAFRQLKLAADPEGILNPGKIIDPPPMDTNLRYAPDYQARGWEPVMSFARQDSLIGAIELCNGAGVCRGDSGVMCPSFQASREEMHSTRGRANLLRALISSPQTDDGRPTTDKRRPPSSVFGQISIENVFDALDLCLACKGCKSECPSLVDMAKLKYEFLYHYYQSHRRKLRDYVFGYIGVLAKLGSKVQRLGNWVLGIRWANSVLGLAPQRQLPRFKARVLRQSPGSKPQSPILYLPDAFTRYFYPDDEAAALTVLRQLDFDVRVLPVEGAGRTLISKGFLPAARRHATRLVAAINALDPAGELPIVGLEPSEIYTLRDEFPDFFPDDAAVQTIARRAWMIDEFIIRQAVNLPTFNVKPATVLLHGHCYQKAQPPAEDGQPVGVPATVAMLEAAGYTVEVIDAGCCGMAGSFGYEAEHYELSMQVGELRLFPAVRRADDEKIIAASGVSCQAQIEDGAGRQAIHPIQLLARRLV